jgi:hypothetical protein
MTQNVRVYNPFSSYFQPKNEAAPQHCLKMNQSCILYCVIFTLCVGFSKRITLILSRERAQPYFAEMHYYFHSQVLRLNKYDT